MNRLFSKTILLPLILLSQILFAGTPVKIGGTVKDSSGEPLPGAGLVIKGTTIGAMTEMDGKFSLEAEKGNTVEVYYLGFKTYTFKVGESVEYNIVLEPDQNVLDEVVVVGYDTQKKVNLTGSVGSLSSETLVNKPIVQASTALQGALPGVTVTTAGGEPGSDGATIRIRGLGTFGNSSAAPLVLIDGVEGDMNLVDATQIEQITVLKDAASSAIYGSRAANGVILVTTKRAGKDKFSVTYHGYVGWQTPTDLPSLVNAVDYMKLSREATENDGGVSAYTDEYIANYLKNNYLDPDNYPITNWQKELLTGNGFTHNHNVTLNAHSGKVSNRTSTGYLNQNGIIAKTGYERFNLRNNLDVDITDKLHFKLDFSGSYGRQNGIPSQSGIFNFMNARDPLMLARWSDGNYAPFTGGSINILPYTEGQGGEIIRHKLNATASAALTWKPFDWWTIEGTVSPRFVLNHNHSFYDMVKYYSDPYGTVSPVSNRQYNELTESQSIYYYGNYLLTTSFQKKFGGAHFAKLLLGASNETMHQWSLSGYRQDFQYTQYRVLNAGMANETMSNGGAEYRWKLLSFFGRLNYNFKERYLLEANVRFDGSSRFAKGHRWGIFPSVSAAWRVSEENWMEESKNVLTELKVRGSWGRLGNQNIGSDYYPTIQALTISNISANNILYPILATNTLANQDISWETSEMFDLGVDASLFNKLTFTADAYYKMTYGILMELDIPATIGLNAPFQNAGKVRNIGWEFAVGYHDSKGKWSWGVDANLSDVYNRIMDMKGTKGGSGAIRNQEGSSINSIFGLNCLGIARTQEDADWVNKYCPQYGADINAGDLVYEDINHDNVIDDNDKTIIGSAIPRLTYGLTFNLGWNGISLSAQFQGVGKADAYISSYYTQPCVQGGTFRTEHLDRWTPETPDGNFPRMSWTSNNNTQTSTFWMGDASYLRLKNLQLGYSLPKKWMKAAKMKSVTIFANATNLLTFSRYYQGYDPENTFTGSGDGVVTGAVASNYPLVKTFTFGVDIKF